MTNKKNIGLICVIAVLALIIGAVFTYAVFPRIETKTVFPRIETKTVPKIVTKDVPGNCSVCPTCKTCEVCKTKAQLCTKQICKDILTTTPNEQLVIDNKLTEEQKKHSSVQTVYLSCADWKARETDNGNLVKNCWKEKRTIIELEPRRNNNGTCAILSVAGC